MRRAHPLRAVPDFESAWFYLPSRGTFLLVSSMSGRTSCAASLLSTPVSLNLGDARKELRRSPCKKTALSTQEFARHLRSAVISGDSERVHDLLRISSHPPPLSSVDPPIICVAAAKGFVDIVGLLIRHGADINARSSEDSTALIYAADSGHLHVLGLLLNAGAGINLTNRHGETALARATRRGWVQCARMLLTYGANPHPMPTDGYSFVVSPLHLARQMRQTAIEQDILTRAICMENKLMEVVVATLPKHICVLEPGHLADTKTLSFFPVQLISEAELHQFVLYFKTPPSYDGIETDTVLGLKGTTPSDELTLVYVVRAQLQGGQATCCLNGPGFETIKISFNGSRKYCKRMANAPEYPGLCVFSVTLPIKGGGLNTLCFESSPSTGLKQGISSPTSLSQATSSPAMVLIGAYRARIDVNSLIQSSTGLSFAHCNKATVYAPR
ncbi:unnamed protein product [Calicophoron daubneyi]|uniref:Uncharacterized protein n=1 Tax=Calicophoron daubneyi TaxID=300641 RepID=A0AAV2T8A6_CALDB